MVQDVVESLTDESESTRLQQKRGKREKSCEKGEDLPDQLVATVSVHGR